MCGRCRSPKRWIYVLKIQLLRVINHTSFIRHQRAAEEVLIGARKRSKSSSRSRRPAAKISHKDQGSADSSSAGAKRARASFQKELFGKLFSQKDRHRSSVRRGTRTVAHNRSTRFGLKPWRIALSNRMTNPA